MAAADALGELGEIDQALASCLGALLQAGGGDALGGMGAYGSWNVGNWCADVQAKYHAQDL